MANSKSEELDQLRTKYLDLLIDLAEAKSNSDEYVLELGHFGARMDMTDIDLSFVVSHFADEETNYRYPGLNTVIPGRLVEYANKYKEFRSLLKNEDKISNDIRTLTDQIKDFLFQGFLEGTYR